MKRYSNYSRAIILSIFIPLVQLPVVGQEDQNANLKLDDWLTQIDSLLSNNLDEEAYESLLAASTLLTDQSPADHVIGYYQLLGDYHLGQDQYEESIDAYSKVLPYLNEPPLNELLTRETGLKLARSINDMGISLARLGRVEEAKQAHFKSQEVYDTYDDPQGGSFNYNNLGLIYKELKQVDSASINFSKGLAYAIMANDTIGIGHTYMNLGVLYTDNQEPVKGLDNLNKALEVFQSINDEPRINYARRIMGQYYRKIQDHASAKPLMFDVLKYYEARDIPRRIGMVNLDIGDLYVKSGQPDSAIGYLNHGLELLLPTKDAKSILKGYFLLGEYHIVIGNTGEALNYFTKSLNLAKGKYQGMAATSGIAIAGIHVSNGDPLRAIQLVEESLALAEGSPMEGNEIRYFDIMYQAYKQLGNQAKALEYLEKYKAKKEEFFNQEKSFEIARIEYANFLEREQAAREAERKRTELAFSQEIARQEWIRYSIIVVALFLATLAFVSYRSYRRKRSDNFLLEEKNENLKILREREKQLAYEALSARERELATMAMSSHEKNSMLQELEQKVSFLENRMNDEVKEDLREMRRTISGSYSLDKSWDTFLHKFKDVHPKFFDKLKEENPGLTINDLKLSAYLKIGMTNKEIANVTHLTLGSVKSSINRLKKKLNMQAADSIRDFVLKYA